MATDSVRIPERFMGPPGSAQGGYTCGVVAGLLGDAVAAVSLRSPPPLERELAVERAGDGVTVRDGERLVAEGMPAALELEAPEPVGAEAAAAASRAGEERWTAVHPFRTCVVCGPGREPGDGYRLFPGAVPGRPGIFAAVWTPDRSLAGDAGAVRRECVWAALDCPTAAPVANYGDGPPGVLARLTARIDGTVPAGRPHVVVSWGLGVDGRKRHAAAALFSPDGECVARSRALWIELRAQPADSHSG
jgi:hypothetical protein